MALFALLLLAFSALGARLVFVQTVEARAYVALASRQREAVIEFPARRGAILDRDGESLAISVDLQTIYADPALVARPADEARALAPVLGRRRATLAGLLRGRRPGSRFEYLARQVEPKVARAVERLGLAGVYMRAEPKRYYPNGRLAAQVLGFVGIDGDGLAGIERQYDGVLKGRPGRMTLEQDPAGRPLPQAEFHYRRPAAGRSLLLTIDKDIQYFTQLTLGRAARSYGASSATAIVLRPATGEILAMANVPDFDPNRFWDFPAATYRNRAVTDVYEPGSSYKVVPASAALEERVVTPRTSFLVPDEMPYADRVFHDSHIHPPENMTVREIIEQSSNVGTIKIGLELGGARLNHYVRRYGFGRATGLGFPGESAGIVQDRSAWSGSTIATIPLGQGVAVTALQMAAAYAALANDGVWVEPRLLHGSMAFDGELQPSRPSSTRRVVSRRAAEQMTSILRGVVTRGTGIEAGIPGYAVAGKTGTAQKPLPTGGYGDSYVSSFAGFAPARRPAIVTVVVFDEPDPIWGGSTAAPTFKLISEFALRNLSVVPSANAERDAARLEAARQGALPAHD